MANFIVRNIPNTLTCGNLVSGCIAVGNAFFGLYDWAFLFIVIGAVFDFFDGMSARLLGVSSPIGKELDSLADCVTFGVAPSAMVFTLLSTMDVPHFLQPIGFLLPYWAFLIAAFSALRLAKFNLDERQTTSFIGLPTPANALFWASLIVGAENFVVNLPLAVLFVMAMVVVSSGLLVAELPMFSLKFKHWGWKGNEVRYSFLGVCVLLLATLRLTGFAAIVVVYVAYAVYGNCFRKK